MARATAAAKHKSAPAEEHWERLEPAYGPGLAPRASLGLIALATDRAGALDFEEFVRPAKGVAVFSTRLPMAPVATPETLLAMGPHLTDTTRLILPGSKLDVVAYSCTSGTAAIGLDAVKAAIHKVRPGIPVATPMGGGAEALRMLKCKRITLLVPYRVETANIVSGFFRDNGFEILRQATFALNGDPDMNRVSAECLIEAGRRVFDPSSDALFLSCTGLYTSPVVDALEQAIGKPVITSNQALAWQALRQAGVEDRLEGRGMLFRKA